jgi:seryl-tRNA synthetase
LAPELAFVPQKHFIYAVHQVMAKSAELDDFDEQLYKVIETNRKDKEKPREYYLIATSEQPISAYHRNEWIPERDLPLRYCGLSSCFRKEAGSHGIDVRGLFRVHQFDKVEQFLLTEPEDSEEHHQEMLQASEEFYQSLGISYQVVQIVSGALNNSAASKYDLEGWFPGQGKYRELVSVSNCTDYQSRALEIRCGAKKLGDRDKRYVHMLNGTLEK